MADAMQDARSCSDAELVEHIDSLQRDIGARRRAQLAWIAEYDRRRRWAPQGCRDMAQWLAGRLGITNWAAQRWVACAHALEGLPQCPRPLAPAC